MSVSRRCQHLLQAGAGTGAGAERVLEVSLVTAAECWVPQPAWLNSCASDPWLAAGWVVGVLPLWRCLQARVSAESRRIRDQAAQACSKPPQRTRDRKGGLDLQRGGSILSESDCGNASAHSRERVFVAACFRNVQCQARLRRRPTGETLRWQFGASYNSLTYYQNL